jgi:hypothetical protein
LYSVTAQENPIFEQAACSTGQGLSNFIRAASLLRSEWDDLATIDADAIDALFEPLSATP